MKDIISRLLVTQVRSVMVVGERLLKGRAGGWFLGLISFIESALPVPILTDPFLVAYILANQKRAAFAVALTTITSVVGGVVALLTAHYFFSFITTHVSPQTVLELQALSASASESTFVIALLGAFTPIPYTLTAWAIGIINGSIWLFVVASILGRGARYAIVGYAAHRFGTYALERSRWYLIGASVALVVSILVYIIIKM